MEKYYAIRISVLLLKMKNNQKVLFYKQKIWIFKKLPDSELTSTQQQAAAKRITTVFHFI
jgi:hypothetical protein